MASSTFRVLERGIEIGNELGYSNARERAGFPMILEGIITTVSAAGEINIAPMGPHVADDFKTFVLRPFPTSQTYRNLCEHGEGVLHVTDDVLLLARAAVGRIEPLPPLLPAARVRGLVLQEACRWFEFRVLAVDDREERIRMEAEVVHAGTLRDFFGFNRAKHAVVEAAILATRKHLLPATEIAAEYRKLEVIVGKTGGAQERAAFAFLKNYVNLHDGHDGDLA